MPDGYDDNHPYRLVMAYAWSGASASQVVSANYFTFATLDSKNTIFAAPDAADGAGTWSNGDVAFTDAILTQLEGDLCVDKSRVFASGFSFGGGMAMALACTRADVFRAVAFFSGADLTVFVPRDVDEADCLLRVAGQPGQRRHAGDLADHRGKEAGRVRGDQRLHAGALVHDVPSGRPAAHLHELQRLLGRPPDRVLRVQRPARLGAEGSRSEHELDAPEAWKFITQF